MNGKRERIILQAYKKALREGNLPKQVKLLQATIDNQPLFLAMKEIYDKHQSNHNGGIKQ